jgi:hypothetical protein
MFKAGEQAPSFRCSKCSRRSRRAHQASHTKLVYACTVSRAVGRVSCTTQAAACTKQIATKLPHSSCVRRRTA